MLPASNLSLLIQLLLLCQRCLDHSGSLRVKIIDIFSKYFLNSYTDAQTCSQTIKMWFGYIMCPRNIHVRSDGEKECLSCFSTSLPVVVLYQHLFKPTKTFLVWFLGNCPCPFPHLSVMELRWAIFSFLLQIDLSLFWIESFLLIIIIGHTVPVMVTWNCQLVCGCVLIITPHISFFLGPLVWEKSEATACSSGPDALIWKAVRCLVRLSFPEDLLARKEH